MRHLPLFFDSRGAKIILVGTGKAAAQRLRHLQDTAADIIVLANHPEKPPEKFLLDLASAHENTRLLHRDFSAQDLDAKLIFLAPETADERKRAAEIAALARERNIPVNAVDDKALCDFYMPSMVKRTPVVVAIGTEGTAPLLARRIKGEIEKLLPQNLGTLARTCGELRSFVKDKVPHALRRHFWRRFFDSAIADKVAHGLLPARRLTHLAEDLAENPQKLTARLDFIAAASTEDLSHSARFLLSEADAVIYDSDMPEAVLNLVRRDADFIATDSGSFAPHIIGDYTERNRRPCQVVRLLRLPPIAAAETERFKRLLPDVQVIFHSPIYQPTEKAA